MSVQDTLLLEVTADKDVSNLIENALQNAGIPYKRESVAPFKIRVPSYPTVVALLLTVLEAKVLTAAGKITSIDGAVFKLNPEGLKEMKQRLISKVSSTAVVNPAGSSRQGETGLLDVLRELLKDPEATGKLVREVAGALRGDPQIALEKNKQVSRFALTIMILMGVVIIGATILGYYGRIDGSSVGLAWNSHWQFLRIPLPMPSHP